MGEHEIDTRAGWHGWPAVALRGPRLSTVIVPQLGGKIVSLRDHASGREWLLPPQRPYREAEWGDEFAAHDASGLDECFPSVAAGRHASLSGAGLENDLPDHGELWSRAWALLDDEDGILLEAYGLCWPYALRRRAVLEADALLLEYRLLNEAHLPLSHAWSAHPLLTVEPGMRIGLPDGVDRLLVDWASDPRLGGHGEERPWPRLAPDLDLSLVADRGAGLAVKAFTPALSVGRATIGHPGQEALAVEWDVAAAPWLGLWLCYGGWPTDGRPGHLTVALEPCCGRPDSLAEVVARRECREIAPGGEASWWVRLRVVDPSVEAR